MNQLIKQSTYNISADIAYQKKDLKLEIIKQ